MSNVKITVVPNIFNLCASDLKDGVAYECSQGDYLIGNKTSPISSNGTTIVAFAIDGTTYYTSDTSFKFREVNMHITIEK